MLNITVFIGRLVADPDLRYTAGEGLAVCNFRVAVDRQFGKNDEADFFRVVTWRKLAEVCAEHLTKGRLVAIVGSSRLGTYTDKEGVKRLSHEVHANQVVFLDSQKDNSSATDTPAPPPAPPEDEDVPF